MKLTHNIIVKGPGLLPMLYTPGELASELVIPERTLRDWLNAGAPHQRDESQHIWINGTRFAKWVVSQRKPKCTVKLGDDSAFCLRCNCAVKLIAPEIRYIKGMLLMIKGVCPKCGSKINRGTRWRN